MKTDQKKFRNTDRRTYKLWAAWSQREEDAQSETETEHFANNFIKASSLINYVDHGFERRKIPQYEYVNSIIEIPQCFMYAAEAEKLQKAKFCFVTDLTTLIKETDWEKDLIPIRLVLETRNEDPIPDNKYGCLIKFQQLSR